MMPQARSVVASLAAGWANEELFGRPHECHCEERSDEAISILGMVDCFALLAMTYRAASPHDFAFALTRPGTGLPEILDFVSCLRYAWRGMCAAGVGCLA